MRNPEARVSDPNEFVCDPGSPIRPVYSGKVMKDGKIELTETGTEDIQEKIDSYRDTCDMAFILRQLALGDTSVINAKDPMYGDFTKAPSSLMEAKQMMIDGEAAFMKLPLEVRNEFENNFMNWLFSAGTEEWVKKMESLNGNPVLKGEEVKKEEVNADVS